MMGSAAGCFLSMTETKLPDEGRAVINRYALLLQAPAWVLKLILLFLGMPAGLLALPEELTGIMWHGSFWLAAAVLFMLFMVTLIPSSISMLVFHAARYHIYHSGGECEHGGDVFMDCPTIKEQNKHWFFRGISNMVFVSWYVVLFSQLPALFSELTLATGGTLAIAVYVFAWIGVMNGLDAALRKLLKSHIGIEVGAQSDSDSESGAQEPLPLDHPAVVACEERLNRIASVPGVSKLNWALRFLRPKVDDTKLGVVSKLEQLEKTFGIEIRMARQSYEFNDIVVTATSLGKAEFCGELLKPELSVYPAQVFSKFHFKRIILCSDVKHSGESLQGLADVESETLYLSIPAAGEEFWFRRVLHHEIFHLVDFHDDFEGLHDAGWEKLNQLRKDDQSDSVGKGYLNDYCRTGVHEDKAECFSTMITSYNQVLSLTKEDEVLALKFERMKQLLRKVDRRFDDDFWLERSAASAASGVLDVRPGVAICSHDNISAQG